MDTDRLGKNETPLRDRAVYLVDVAGAEAAVPLRKHATHYNPRRP